MEYSAMSLLSDTDLYGAIDLGTNTCRLLIAKPHVSNGRLFFTPVSSLSRIIRLGEEVLTTKKLCPQAMERALIVLEECARRLDFYRVDYIRCVGTAACRSASNIEEFREKIRAQTGLHLEVIPALEESKLAVSGCIDLLDQKIPTAIVFDIGGGSTEIACVDIMGKDTFRIRDAISLPYGILSLREPNCSVNEHLEASNLISEDVNEFAIRNDLYKNIQEGSIQMVGASGTVTTLAAMILNLSRYDRSQVHEARLWRKDLTSLLPYLKTMTRPDRLVHPCIGPQRSDFIMGGVAIFQGIYDILGVDPIIVADRGVREGILRNLFEVHAS